MFEVAGCTSSSSGPYQAARSGSQMYDALRLSSVGTGTYRFSLKDLRLHIFMDGCGRCRHLGGVCVYIHMHIYVCMYTLVELVVPTQVP